MHNYQQALSYHTPLWLHHAAFVTHGGTDGRTDRPTNRPMDRTATAIQQHV